MGERLKVKDIYLPLDGKNNGCLKNGKTLVRWAAHDVNGSVNIEKRANQTVTRPHDKHIRAHLASVTSSCKKFGKSNT